jgi:hypothetical protein
MFFDWRLKAKKADKGPPVGAAILLRGVNFGGGTQTS